MVNVSLARARQICRVRSNIVARGDRDNARTHVQRVYARTHTVFRATSSSGEAATIVARFYPIYFPRVPERLNAYAALYLHARGSSGDLFAS